MASRPRQRGAKVWGIQQEEEENASKKQERNTKKKSAAGCHCLLTYLIVARSIPPVPLSSRTALPSSVRLTRSRASQHGLMIELGRGYSENISAGSGRQEKQAKQGKGVKNRDIATLDHKSIDNCIRTPKTYARYTKYIEITPTSSYRILAARHRGGGGFSSAQPAPPTHRSRHSHWTQPDDPPAHPPAPLTHRLPLACAGSTYVSSLGQERSKSGQFERLRGRYDIFSPNIPAPGMTCVRPFVIYKTDKSDSGRPETVASPLPLHTLTVVPPTPKREKTQQASATGNDKTAFDRDQVAVSAGAGHYPQVCCECVEATIFDSQNVFFLFFRGQESGIVRPNPTPPNQTQPN